MTDRLILSAGTLGSTFLLLRNHAKFPRISNQLGANYSTNGDVLAFAMECLDSSALPPGVRLLDASRGPVITTTAEVDFANGRGGGMIQDAGYPEFINWLAESYDVGRLLPRLLRFVKNRIIAWWTRDPRSEIDSEISRLLGPAIRSSTSLPLLGMGSDNANGQLRLRSRGRHKTPVLDVDWSPDKSKECFDTLTQACRKISDKLGGTFVANPLTHFLRRLITVHPLGGCPMGDNIDEGVVDRNGAVFNYPGLYVADGSVMPGPVGCNPSLTIAAVSRHIACEILNSTK